MYIATCNLKVVGLKYNNFEMMKHVVTDRVAESLEDNWSTLILFLKMSTIGFSDNSWSMSCLRIFSGMQQQPARQLYDIRGELWQLVSQITADLTLFGDRSREKTKKTSRECKKVGAVTDYTVCCMHHSESDLTFQLFNFQRFELFDSRIEQFVVSNLHLHRDFISAAAKWIFSELWHWRSKICWSLAGDCATSPICPSPDLKRMKSSLSETLIKKLY